MTLSRASLIPPPVTQVRLSLVPCPPASPTLPPPVRAARMFKTVREVAAGMARRLPRHVDVDDLVGAGALGLADAFSRRNGMPGTEFEAFASYRIRGAMLDELRRLDAMPRRSRTRAKQFAEARRTVEQRSGAAAKDEEVAKELGLCMNTYQDIRAKLEASRGPIHVPGSEGNEDSMQEIADAKMDPPDVMVARAEVSALVVEGINTLPARVRRVLVGLYVEGETLKQIGATLGVSESRVCQIHTEALAQLRARFADEQPGDAPPASGVHLRGVVPLQAPGKAAPRRAKGAS